LQFILAYANLIPSNRIPIKTEHTNKAMRLTTMSQRNFYCANNAQGVTLIELIIVLSIISILAALVAIGPGFTSTERIRSAAKELLSDLQWLRYSAMTQGPDAACPQLRGLGIRFESNGIYRLFRFNDTNANFNYDGIGEERQLTKVGAGSGQRDIHPPLELKIKKSGELVNPDNAVLLFDHFGIPRQTNLGFQQMSVVFQHQEMNELQKKCVSVSFNRIREGIWNENECQEQ
jgi:prepilin-type N-terminal cleavage/methylation domain-containing protein